MVDQKSVYLRLGELLLKEGIINQSQLEKAISMQRQEGGRLGEIFVKLGFVTEVAEKNPISDIATVGVYYWKRGSDYVKYAEQMIENNKRVNNEFYVCPVFNEAIKGGSQIRIFEIEKMWGLGTPEDLEVFLKQ